MDHNNTGNRLNKNAGIDALQKAIDEDDDLACACMDLVVPSEETREAEQAPSNDKWPGRFEENLQRARSAVLSPIEWLQIGRRFGWQLRTPK